MLFRRSVLEAIAAGRVTLAFRRWRRPTVRPGGRLRTEAGVLAIERVDVVAAGVLTDAEARQAGYPDREALLAALPGEAPLHRVALRFAGPDARVALRKEPLDADGVSDLLATLGRHGACGSGLALLRLIGEAPATAAAALARRAGCQTPAFKRAVRRLKELGLTESLAVGYRLLPRGESLLRAAPRSG